MVFGMWCVVCVRVPVRVRVYRNSSEALNGSMGSGDDGFMGSDNDSTGFDPGSPLPPPAPDDLPPPPLDM